MRQVVWQVTKQIGLIVGLLGGLLFLWEIPQNENNAHSHKDQVLQLGTNLSQYDIQRFLHHIKTRLPNYRDEFKRAEKDSGIPWVLLAALSYQESKWNRNAISPTGVRGLMMLTRATAADLGIHNRLDPSKSIAGGARYLSRMYKRVPHDVELADRMFVALAAYNVGLGHVKDAQLLAKRLGKQSNQWNVIKEVLPLLAKKKYYKDLPHRFARGWEPVKYVKRIRAYRKILDQVVDREAPSEKVEI